MRWPAAHLWCSLKLMPAVSLTAWIGFAVFVVAMLVIDLGLFQRRDHAMSTKEALAWFGVWLALAMMFNVGVAFLHPRGVNAGLEFFTGYLVEKSLSVDNI